MNVLLEEQVQSKVNTTLQSVQNSLLTRLTSAVKYVLTNTRSNQIISSLHINMGVQIRSKSEEHFATSRMVPYYDATFEFPLHGCGKGNLTLLSMLGPFSGMEYMNALFTRFFNHAAVRQLSNELIKSHRNNVEWNLDERKQNVSIGFF